MTVERDLLAAAFEHSAAAYEKGRPGYPPDALEHLAATVGIGPGRRVLDLAAGTGKLSRQLRGFGADVVAVEPLPAMREQLAAAVPGAEVLAGSAEAIPLPDASVDVVSVAQAFHWFDLPRALAEIDRVLRPGGWLVAIWNEIDETVPDAKRLFAVVRTAGTRPQTIEVDWRRPFDESLRFEPARRARYRWVDSLAHDELVASVESRSYVTVLEPEAKAEFMHRLHDVIATLPEPTPLPYFTEVYWCRKPGPASNS